MENKPNKRILVVIPARGGSKGIPRKNVRILVDKPLISYSIDTALKSKFKLDIYVSTDDEEIASISSLFGANVITRSSELSLDSVTLDPVIYDALIQIENNAKEKYDIVITMQPTSPLLKYSTLDNAIQYFLENDFDTVISCINSPHLSWSKINNQIKPNYIERLNRQYLPKHFIETGAFIISKRACVTKNTRFGEKVSVFEVPNNESIDIDTPQDWWIAEKEILKKNILIRVEGYSEIGLGHIYRGLLLAYNLIDHNLKFLISSKSDLGIKKIKENHFPYEIINNDEEIMEYIQDFQCDILINDILDTSEEYIIFCKSCGVRVVNFEDLGSGSNFADAVINDLYDKKNDLNNFYWGSDYYCIRDEFLLAEHSTPKESVKEILIIFGGTDPSNLTSKLLQSISLIEQKEIHYTFILGMGYNRKEELTLFAEKNCLNVDFVYDVKRTTDYMSKADIAVSSQGRTMLELASLGVPTILLAQNDIMGSDPCNPLN